MIRKLEATFERLEEDAFQPSLCTHKLHGELSGSFACSVDYNFRLLFKIAVEHKTEVIVLLDLGTHDEVY